MQRPGAGELAREQRYPFFFGQLLVVLLHIGAPEQLGDHRLVHVAALPEVDRREMKAEEIQLALQRAQAAIRKPACALLFQSSGDRIQIRSKFVAACIRRTRGDGRRGGAVPGQAFGGGSEPRVDARDGAAVGLVAPVAGLVARLRGERLDCRRRRVDARRERELLAEQVHFLEVMREHEPRMLGERGAQHLRGDVGIAVAVAADPGADGEKRRQPRHGREAEALLQRLLELGVQARQLLQEGEAEVLDAVHDLVGDLEARAPQHRGEPEPQNFRMERFISFLVFGFGKKAGDLPLAIQDALSLYFGGVRGEHRADVRPAKPFHQLVETKAAYLVQRE